MLNPSRELAYRFRVRSTAFPIPKLIDSKICGWTISGCFEVRRVVLYCSYQCARGVLNKLKKLIAPHRLGV